MKKQRHPTRKPPQRKSTALARRPPAKPAPKKKHALVRRPAAAAALEQAALTDDIALGQLGLAEIKLTAAEEKILAEPVAIADIMVKPTGAIYLSHPAYTKWLNRAFGRTGWSIIPASKPMKTERSVVCPYVLYIHGRPAAFAMGEQDYFDNNKEQTYGDALESTVASALRRCAKRLGIGLELWDRAFSDRFMEEHAVKVWLEGKEKPQFRLKSARSFWNEQKPRGGKVSVRHADDASTGRIIDVERVPPAGHNAEGHLPITAEQVRRLWTIARRGGRKDDEIKGWLLRRFKLDSTKDIQRNDYEFICAMLESPATLPEKDFGSREPGEEG